MNEQDEKTNKTKYLKPRDIVEMAVLTTLVLTALFAVVVAIGNII